MLRAAVSLVILLVASLAIAQDKPVARPKVAPTPYERGQIWRYADRSGTPDATITILDVEPRRKGGAVVHIRVEGLPSKDCGVHPNSTVEHLAVTEKTLQKNTLILVKEQVDLPDEDFASYREWQKQKEP